MADDYEIRMCDVSDVRVESRGVAKMIRGYAIVFNSLSEPIMGLFREKIAPQAMERTINEGIDLRALVDHDSAKILGRRSAGTLRYESDTHGLRTEIDPPDTTTALDIIQSIQRRDVTGMSFAFRTLKDEWDETTEPYPTRTVLDMLVREVSIVTFPAYPSTEVAMRSLSAYRQSSGRKGSIAARLEAAEARAAAWQKSDKRIVR
jgi:Escherichia/Staphylococcus phage prohead protease